MRMNRILLVPAALAVLLMAGPAEAQYYGGGGYGYGPPPPRPAFGYRHRIHFYVGAELTGIGVLAQKTDATTGGYLGQGGGGGGLFAGVRLGPFFALELNWNITYHNVMQDYLSYYGDYWSAFHLQTLELDGKVHIPTRGPIEPYIQAGVGFAFLGVSWDNSYYDAYGDSGGYVFASGPAFNIGGGLDFWLSPFFSLGGRVLYKGMRFSDPENFQSPKGNGKYTNFASAINVDLNATIHF